MNMLPPSLGSHQKQYPRYRLLTVFCTASLLVSSVAAAEEYTPNPLEFAPEGAVECSWSKLKRVEYQNCLAKKRYFAEMSDDEKAAYNEKVKERRTQERIRQLERNQVIYPPYKPQ